MSSSSSKRQMMQPWPLCLVSFNKTPSKDRTASPKQYFRVPNFGRSSSTTGSTISEDCASNTTLLTNTSPFNSQQALISNKKKGNIVKNINNSNINNNCVQSHYYSENIKHENDLRNTKNYNPLTKEVDLTDFKQLEPLINNSVVIETAEMDIEEIKNKENDRRPIGWQIPVQPPANQFPKPRRPFDRYLGYIYQVVAALSVSLGSMVVGFSCSYTSPALVSMKDRNITSFEINPQIESWIGSIMPLSALIGGIAGGPSIEYLGRRNTILATAFPFIAAWMFIAMASNVALVLVGRALCGFSVGVASLSLPVYLGETIQAEVRGTLGLLPTAFGNIGILIGFIAGMYLNWSELAFFGMCLPIPFLLTMFLIPETPRWYVSKGDMKNARKSLQWLRGKNADINDELASVEKIHVESEKNEAQSSLSEIFKSNNVKPLLISLGLMFFQQMSGINAVIFYTTQIFKDAGSSIDSNICTIIVGVVNFVSTFIATGLIDHLGRKILLYISSIAMTITLTVLGLFFYFKDNNYYVADYGWIPLVSFVIYVIGFSLGFGPIPWLMMGEILPAKIRGPAASIATSFNWSCTFIVTKTFKDIILAIGTSGTFIMFAVIVAIGLVFIILFVPETRGRSLEEIEKRLTGPVRRMSAVANIKPMPTAC